MYYVCHNTNILEKGKMKKDEKNEEKKRMNPWFYAIFWLSRQKRARAPFFFEPLDGNGRSPVFCVSTATSLTTREMSDNEPLRCQRMCRVSRHKFSSSPARPWTIGRIVHAPGQAPKRLRSEEHTSEL